MLRKRILVHAITWASIIVLIIIAGTPTETEAANDVKSVPVYVQSRPVYQKPSPVKPKLVLAKQLHPQLHLSGKSGKGEVNVNPNLVTQTVYGFLDFVTTIGNTVMVFTPQTKKVELAQPSIVATAAVKEPEPTSTQLIEEETTTTENSNRQPKLIPMNDSSEVEISPILEASEYEPQVFPTPAPTPTPTTTTMSTDSMEMKYVSLVTESTESSQNSESSESPPPAVVDAAPENKIQSEINVVSAESEAASAQPTSKGFTLKFSRPPTTTPLPVEEGEALPAAAILPVNPDEKTGLVNQIFETRTIDGVTTVHETRVMGTYIGSQYVRVLESTSTVLPVVVVTATHPPPPPPPTPKPTKAPSTTTKPPKTTPKTTPSPPSTTSKKFIALPPKTLPKAVTTPELPLEIFTEQSVVSSSGNQEGFDDEDERFNEDVAGEDEDGSDFEISSSSVQIDPTPTSSDDQTLYVLPHKEKTAQIYVSAVSSPDSYSRQPQIYVDISPAKSFDNVVTATPTRKQFRQQNSRNEYLNRFSNRFRTPSSTESNELTERPVQIQTPEPATSEESGRRGSSRFRSRNRGSSKSPEADILPTVSVYSNTVTPTQSRRFNPSAGVRARSVGGKPFQEATSFKTSTAQRGGGYSPATRQIAPTSSSSIYRFKLNRPTGRWRFKPSPKPKVNIIKTKEEEEQGQEQISSTSLTARELPGPVYAHPIPTGNDGEIQIIEETRTESNELAQDNEPELVPHTIRVATITPTDFTDLDKYLEVATIRSPYVFQAGKFKNTRFITLTKTFTKEVIQPTQALGPEATLENILATRAPYEKILEGSSDVATLPVIVLGADMATPPLETVTQTFSTTQLMLKTSILPALYDGVTTLYTLTQSYFVTRVVRALKTVPPMELFQFVPTKSLTEFNTALQEAGSEHREQLLGSESDDDAETAYQHIVAPPDELTLVGSDFDPTSMDDKFPKALANAAKASKALSAPKAKPIADPGLPDLSKFTPEQIALLRYFSAASSGQQPQLQFPLQFPTQGQPQLPQNYYPSPLLPAPQQPQFQLTSSPVIYDTVTTIVESKTLRIQFGAKPSQTTVYSTKIVPTKLTSFVTMSVPATAAIPNFFQQGGYPLPYVG